MTQFKPGNVPWNKGLKGIHLSPQSQFTPADRGDKHCCWKGGIQVNTNDCIYIQNPDKAYDRVRRPRKVYEQAFGKIPPGFIIVHRDGDRHNDDPSNLEAISRAEHIKRNNPRTN